MISRFYRALMTFGSVLFFSFALVLGLAVENSSAAQSFTQLVDSSHAPIAIMERVKSTAKDLEGKTQEAIGNVTGDAENQIIGKAKQAEADSRRATENIKEGIKLPERLKANVEDLGGKTQEAVGNLTGDRRDQIAGKAKQVKSSTRNLVEDAKDAIKGFFE
jgi:uncharacterized protein YjbJ (UPF0337 family)